MSSRNPVDSSPWTVADLDPPALDAPKVAPSKDQEPQESQVDPRTRTRTPEIAAPRPSPTPDPTSLAAVEPVVLLAASRDDATGLDDPGLEEVTGSFVEIGSTEPVRGTGVVVLMRMAVAFSAALILSYVLVAGVWMGVFSPLLHQRLAARPVPPPPEPVIVEIIKPVPVIVEVPAAPVTPEPDAALAAAMLTPDPAPAPTPRPVRRATSRPAPVRAEPEPEVPPAAEPVAKPPAAVSKPAAVTPPAADALDGRLSGKIAGGQDLMMKLDFLPGGVLSGLVMRDDVARPARGNYSLQEDGAVIALVEEGPEGASYTGTIDADGLRGRVTGFDERSRRIRMTR